MNSDIRKQMNQRYKLLVLAQKNQQTKDTYNGPYTNKQETNVQLCSEKQKVTIGEINFIIQPRQKNSGHLSKRFKANKQDQKLAQSKTMVAKF